MIFVCFLFSDKFSAYARGGGGWAHLELTEPLKKSNPIFHIFSVDPVMRVHITVEPRFTGTRLIRNIASNDSFSLSLVEIKRPLTFS